MLYTYDAKSVKIVFGPMLMSGFGDGDFITINQDAETYTDEVGSDGEVVRSRSNDNRGTITITLQASSLLNQALSLFHEADKVAPNLALGVAPFLCTDLNGLSLHAASQAWIQKPADVAYGRESGTREWVIRCADLISNIAGIGA